MLRGLPVQVDVVGDGMEAVDAASRFAYDVIFMDMRMPEMDGLAATRLIRQRGGALARVPIVALTANAFPEDVKACFDAGMNSSSQAGEQGRAVRRHPARPVAAG